VVNTNWDILKEKDEKDFYLLNGRHWLTAENLEGPWEAAKKLPKDVDKIPNDENWADVKTVLPIGKGNTETPAPWVLNYTS
jgi:hypothetical protein